MPRDMVLIINKLCHTQWLLAADANAKTTTLHIDVFWLDLVWGILCDLHYLAITLYLFTWIKLYWCYNLFHVTRTIIRQLNWNLICFQLLWEIKTNWTIQTTLGLIKCEGQNWGVKFRGKIEGENWGEKLVVCSLHHIICFFNGKKKWGQSIFVTNGE